MQKAKSGREGTSERTLCDVKEATHNPEESGATLETQQGRLPSRYNYATVVHLYTIQSDKQ